VIFFCCDYEEALVYANLTNIPGIFWNDVLKIAALGRLSRLEEAADLAAKFQIQFPGKAQETCSILKKILFDDLFMIELKKALLKQGCRFDTLACLQKHKWLLFEFIFFLLSIIKTVFRKACCGTKCSVIFYHLSRDIKQRF
jgi:hypothetical protein